jgi:mono/diheme cytochrome c family protein
MNILLVVFIVFIGCKSKPVDEETIPENAALSFYNQNCISCHGISNNSAGFVLPSIRQVRGLSKAERFLSQRGLPTTN